MGILTEVKMSPSVFERGIQDASGEGVLIGFEFEFVTKVETLEGIKVSSDAWKKAVDFKSFLGWVTSTTDINEDGELELSDRYLDWAKRVTNDLLKSLSDDGESKLLSLYDEFNPKRTLTGVTRFITTNSTKSIEKTIVNFLELEDYEETEDYETLVAHFHTTRIQDFVEDEFGSIEKMLSSLSLGYSPKEKEHNDTYLLVAEKVAKITRESIAKSNVHVIEVAKTITKNVTDWYVEPDATINPNDPKREAGVELVSPPLPVKEAMEALNAFYKTAKEAGWYTNGSTGIHINISIPKKIDVLKLAVFLGDEYLLKTFGREASSMAVSVFKNLQKGADADNINSLDPDNLKRLSQSALYFANDHYASISYEMNPDTLKQNRYISFRHAGGDYLNKLPLIRDTVGRLVTAMLIASDKNKHKNEYMKKLFKLISSDSK